VIDRRKPVVYLGRRGEKIVSLPAINKRKGAYSMQATKKCGWMLGAAVGLVMAVASGARADDIVGVAAKSGHFKTLVAAIKAADLVQTLQGAGPFTVFAPTDAAFAKLPKGTVAKLLQPENKAQLAAILTYHVVSGKVLAADVMKLSSGTAVATVNGARVTVTRKGHQVRINNARLVQTDIEADNGVIHVIDRVLLPPAQ
jgi:transforming growth factor-beta-induced protein